MCFQSWFHLLLKVLECRWCTRAEKVLSSLRLELTAQGASLQCSEPSVIPLSYPGAQRATTHVTLIEIHPRWQNEEDEKEYFLWFPIFQSMVLFKLTAGPTEEKRPPSSSVWPVWAIFERSQWQIFFQKRPKYLVTLLPILKNITI